MSSYQLGEASSEKFADMQAKRIKEIKATVFRDLLDQVITQALMSDDWTAAVDTALEINRRAIVLEVLDDIKKELLNIGRISDACTIASEE